MSRARVSSTSVAEVVAVVARRIERVLQRRELAATSEERGVPDAWVEEAPVLAGLGAAAVQGLVVLGSRAGARVQWHGEAPEETDPLTPGPCHAQLRAFDLHAGIGTRAGQRERLERLCQYALRPPVEPQPILRNRR